MANGILPRLQDNFPIRGQQRDLGKNKGADDAVGDKASSSSTAATGNSSETVLAGLPGKPTSASSSITSCSPLAGSSASSTSASAYRSTESKGEGYRDQPGGSLAGEHRLSELPHRERHQDDRRLPDSGDHRDSPLQTAHGPALQENRQAAQVQVPEKALRMQGMKPMLRFQSSIQEDDAIPGENFSSAAQRYHFKKQDLDVLRSQEEALQLHRSSKRTLSVSKESGKKQKYLDEKIETLVTHAPT